MTRRTLASLLTATPGLLLAQSTPEPPAAPLAYDLVKDFVGKAHQRKIEPMQELLKREPALIYASWDWGAGDHENALQAAAHTGSREMALFLLEQGARMDIFAGAMLGNLELLKASSKLPGFIKSRGAHRIPLVSHAVVGGTEARAALDFLLAEGADVNAQHSNGMTPLMMAVQTRQRETVQLLLSKGADPKTKAKTGVTALAISTKNNEADIAEDLRKAGATD